MMNGISEIVISDQIQEVRVLSEMFTPATMLVMGKEL